MTALDCLITVAHVIYGMYEANRWAVWWIGRGKLTGSWRN